MSAQTKSSTNRAHDQKRNGNFRLVGIPPNEIKFGKILPFLLDQKNFTGAILGGRKINTLMLEFAARHNIRPQIEELPMVRIHVLLI